MGRAKSEASEASELQIALTCGICGLNCGSSVVLLREHSCAAVVRRVREEAAAMVDFVRSAERSEASLVVQQFPVFWELLWRRVDNLRKTLGT